MAIGDWVIGDFIPSNVALEEYSQKEVVLTCASFKKDDGSDPVDEVLQVQDMVAFGYDNSNIIGGGTVLQSYDPDDIVTITDGFETFFGVVTNVITNENSESDLYIKYQIKITKYLPPKPAVSAYVLADGDETVFDDDWEVGYEQFTECVNSSEQIASAYRWAAGTKEGVTVYRHDYIQGAPYKAGYGYLQPYKSFPVNLKGYTVVIKVKPSITPNLLFNIAYGGAGKATIGEFGELVYVAPTQIPDAIFSINGHNYNIPWTPGSSIDSIRIQAFLLKVSDVIDSGDIDGEGYAYIAFRVDTSFVTFYVQMVSAVNSDVPTIPDVCNEKDNEVPVFQVPSGKLLASGGSRPSPVLYVNLGYSYNIRSFSGGG